MAYVIRTDRLGLRRLREDDLDEMTVLLGDPNVMVHYSRPKSRDEAMAWIDWNLGLYEEHGFGLWAVERLSDGAFLGDCGLTPQVVDSITEIEVGYHIHRRHWGNGYASEAAKACVEYARETLGFDRVVAIMVPENIASRRTAERAGLVFDRHGEHGGRQDVVMKIDFKEHGSALSGHDEIDLRSIFNRDAERYDRARPGYPAEMFEEIELTAGLTSDAQVLEIAPGTGQATLSLAKRGYEVTGVELGSELAGVARRKLVDYPKSRIEVSSFEDWESTQQFNLVVCATAFHWLDPATRLEKVAQRLRPGGWFALIDTVHTADADDQFSIDMQQCYERWDPETPPGFRAPEVSDVSTKHIELDGSALFGPTNLFRYARNIEYSVDEYIDLLMTYSGHLKLPDFNRNGLLTCLRKLIDERYGGSITKQYLTECRLAQVA